MAGPTVSVIIPRFRAHLTNTLQLEALSNQADAPPLEVIHSTCTARNISPTNAAITTWHWRTGNTLNQIPSPPIVTGKKRKSAMR